MGNKNNLSAVDEAGRLNALKQYGILDTFPEKQYDDLTRLASIICESPITLISLIDEDRQWFKSKVGLDVSETERELAFCRYAILEEDIFEVENSLEDQRFVNNPLVTGDPNIRFYAGAPLTTPEGYNIGTLCVIDTKPRKLTPEQREALSILANEVVVNMELRKERNKLIAENLGTVEANKLLMAFFENSPSVILMTDIKGHYIYANRNALNLVKRDSLNEVVGKTAEELFPKHLAEEILLVDAEILNKKVALRKEYQVGFNDNASHYITYSFPLLNEANQIYGVGSITTDITVRKKIEEELIEAREQAEKANFSKSSFLANMSHEIRTPLNAILGFADLLERTSLNIQQSDYLEAIGTSGKNLLAIINDILDFSKIEAGMLGIEAIPFSPNQLIQSLYTMLSAKAQSKNIGFNVSADIALPPLVNGDPTRLNQILINLVGNAIKFTENGSVSISCQLLEQHDKQVKLRFTVSDTGIGIASEKLEKIFDRFTQADNDTTRNFGGTGLGLSIAKKLVELQGGTISVKSVPSKGSEFVFTLEYTIADAAQLTSVDQSQSKVQESSFRGKKILIVEDNSINQKLTTTILSEEGFESRIADNGQKALDILATDSFDAILMDLQMPVLDGYQTTKCIRHDLRLTTPIIAMTANAMAGEKERCLSLGMNGYITKPFKAELLFSTLAKMFNNGNNSADTVKDVKSFKPQEKITDLVYLKEFYGDKESLIKETVEMFLEQNPQDVSALETAFANNDYITLKDVSHGLQTSLGFMGVSAFVLNEVKQLEAAAKDNDLEIIKEKLPYIVKMCQQACNELMSAIKQMN